MRMAHYYGALALLVLPLLLATAATGIWHDGSERHLSLGLFAAIFGVAVHTLVILFMIVTGRILKAAMKARPLSSAFLGELNRFFAVKRAYPLALLGATSIVATAVLGYGHRGFGLSPAVHMLVGLGTVLLNAWALQEEWRSLRRNQELVDRAAAELDRLDRELAAAAPGGAVAAPPDGAPESWASPPLRWLLFAASWWTPYLYWGFFEHRGDFSRVGLHPWLELSVLGLFAAWRTRRRDREPACASPMPVAGPRDGS